MWRHWYSGLFVRHWCILFFTCDLSLCACMWCNFMECLVFYLNHESALFCEISEFSFCWFCEYIWSPLFTVILLSSGCWNTEMFPYCGTNKGILIPELTVSSVYTHKYMYHWLLLALLVLKHLTWDTFKCSCHIPEIDMTLPSWITPGRSVKQGVSCNEKMTHPYNIIQSENVMFSFLPGSRRESFFSAQCISLNNPIKRWQPACWFSRETKKNPKRLLSRLHDVDTFRVEVMTAGTQPTVNCEPASWGFNDKDQFAFLLSPLCEL